MTATSGVDGHEAPRRGRPKEAGLAERRRRQIIESAYVVFAERGYEGTNISDLAAHAGVGQGTVYRYFDSKREILDHVFDFSVEKMLEAVAPSSSTDGQESRFAEPASLDEMIDSIREATTKLFQLVEREPEFLRLVLVEASAIDQELNERVLGLETMASTMVRKGLRRGVEQGLFRADIDPDVLSHAILTLALPGLLLELRGEGSPDARERYVTSVIDIITRALRNPEASR
jgi:AcrR family transcriptional regulator